uniref:Uncharacterized protein LOC104234221 n=1 Tax=Nicotiana sylvestris TaxID=4096 RepID=A0A1U7X5D6_NICSY|nr:PREDICTED: uncharacterized protein LOC104234221 [Nicotiana sylvestris]
MESSSNSMSGDTTSPTNTSLNSTHPNTSQTSMNPNTTQISQPPETGQYHKEKPSFLSILNNNPTSSNLSNNICVQNDINMDLLTTDETENHFLEEEEDIFIPITSEDKERLYRNWETTLIVKVFGRRVRYQFLQRKLQAIWKPNETIFLIDLGYDYYLIKFNKQENYNKAFHEGPWFIGNQFFTIRKWEPRFVASEASLTYSAIWARLPELPTEFYDYEILQKIGNKLGELIRIDACTSSALRGKYVRLCILVPIEKPLKTHIILGKHNQKITYEGFNVLCTNCGRLGHNLISCPNKRIETQNNNTMPSNTKKTPQDVESISTKIENWTIVSHHRRKTKLDMGKHSTLNPKPPMHPTVEKHSPHVLNNPQMEMDSHKVLGRLPTGQKTPSTSILSQHNSKTLLPQKSLANHWSATTSTTLTMIPSTSDKDLPFYMNKPLDKDPSPTK